MLPHLYGPIWIAINQKAVMISKGPFEAPCIYQYLPGLPKFFIGTHNGLHLVHSMNSPLHFFYHHFIIQFFLYCSQVLLHWIRSEIQQPFKQQNTGGCNGESSGWNPHGSGWNPCCSPFYPNAGPTSTSYHLTVLHLTLQGWPHSNWSESAPNTAHHAIYLWSKLVCLFCLYRWDPPNRDASDHVLGLFGKLSTRRSAWAWFHGVWTSVGYFPGSSGNHRFQFTAFSRWQFRLGSGSLFFQKWDSVLVSFFKLGWFRFPVT